MTGSGSNEAETVRPPPEACCGRCGGVRVGRGPCGCDPVGKARELHAQLIEQLLRMTEGERAEFLRESTALMQGAFRGERESRV